MKPVFAILTALLASGVAQAADDQGAWAARIGALTKPAPDEVVFAAAGDAIWNRKISDNRDPALQGLFEVMRGADIAFLNFEQVLADSGYPTVKDIAKADPAIIGEFTWAGVDLVSTANNHAMDFGPSGMETTRKVLTGAGIAFTGAGANVAQAIQPVVIEKKGLKVALVALLVSPQFPQIGTAAEDNAPGAAPIHGAQVRLPGGKAVFAPWEQDVARMQAAVAEARKMADVVAVSLHIHWGGPEEIDATGKQLIAHAAIDAGADIVLGHGPHVVNGIEYYKNRPIFYSVGNFVYQFNPDHYALFPSTQAVIKRLQSDKRQYAATMARMILSRTGQFRRIEILPIGLTDDGDPHLEADARAEDTLARVQSLSAALGTKIRRDGWYATLDIPKGKAK
ncbi:MAG: CapA family protein [Rhodospirillaceae bacterium]|nr:CapA family protein [Rhodospirillaceae bacterium]